MITPIFDPGFSTHSYGFRPVKPVHQVVLRVHGFIRQGYRYAVGIDQSMFCDYLGHDLLMHRLSRHMSDKQVLKLVAYIAANEPPGADPHGRWCGGGKLETHDYPIKTFFSVFLTVFVFLFQ